MTRHAHRIFRTAVKDAATNERIVAIVEHVLRHSSGDPADASRNGACVRPPVHA